ncbi:GTPase [Actinotalea solisilvae]|uniref:GTPase n=1 Tax=Actinotalea solisilvae TaxID=2072922 RepID=UPI0018F26715|nr:GTPase [Actinotalea solisilvae]
MAGVTVAERLDALAHAVRVGRDVMPEAVVEAAQGLEDRAGHRLRLSADHTVAALAGATGSGKSSLLNALAGEPLAEVDVLRPTTSEALAVVRGRDGSAGLLDWLGVRRRHQLPEDDATDAPAGPASGTASGAAPRVRLGRGPRTPGGLILLDLPDHDSVRTEHRLEAERLVALVDLMVWVLDPQKYADAVVHERYLRGLVEHRDVMLVVLNQVDRLTDAERRACHADLQRLLAEDGLAGVRVLDVSARTGEGVDALRAALDDAAARRVAAQARVEADVVRLARQVQAACGPVGRGGRTPSTSELVTSLAGAAGVPAVAEAVRGTRLLRARQATGWPPTRWLSRLRPDPLRRLHLGEGTGGGQGRGERRPSMPDVVRTSVPRPGPAELARVRAAVRDYTDAATASLPDAWVLEARGRTEGSAEAQALPDALDRAVSGTQVISDRRPVWWTVVGVLQWLLLLVAVAGLVWLGVLWGLDALRMPVIEPPAWDQGQVSIPVPTLAAVGGTLVGLILAGIARLLAGVGARRQARRATAHLREAVADVAGRHVVAPVREVLERHDECARAAARAVG